MIIRQGDNPDPEWHEYLPEVENLRNNGYHHFLKDTPNNVFNSANNNIAAYGNVLVNAIDRMHKYQETEFKVGDSVFVAMKTIYSNIRKIYKSGNQKSLAYIFHPVILEIIIAGRRNALQRKRYVVREKYDQQRTLCHAKTFMPVYVYSNELHRATIDKDDISVTGAQALYMNEVEEVPLHDLKWLTDVERKEEQRKYNEKKTKEKAKETRAAARAAGNGFKFRMKTPDTNAVIFQGDMLPQRCPALKKDGAQCTRMACDKN